MELGDYVPDCTILNSGNTQSLVKLHWVAPTVAAITTTTTTTTAWSSIT
jgi:hypothetical protein